MPMQPLLRLLALMSINAALQVQNFLGLWTCASPDEATIQILWNLKTPPLPLNRKHNRSFHRMRMKALKRPLIGEKFCAR